MKPAPIACVIGYPVGHSRSPRLHGHWLQRYQLRGHYVALQVAPADLEATLSLLPRIGFVGGNVTLPHKEKALSLANVSTDLARRIGAANTLTFQGDTILADNTDAEGFTRNILSTCPDWAPRTVALIGAGGASRAVIVALQDRGATEIRLVNRSHARAQALAEEFANVRAFEWTDRHELLQDCDTLINATSQGMAGQDPLDLYLDALPEGAIVNDLIYTPLETPLLVRARVRGHRVVDGLGMLLHQAVPGFQRWFGAAPVVDQALRDAVLA